MNFIKKLLNLSSRKKEAIPLDVQDDYIALKDMFIDCCEVIDILRETSFDFNYLMCRLQKLEWEACNLGIYYFLSMSTEHPLLLEKKVMKLRLNVIQEAENKGYKLSKEETNV